MVVVVVVVVWLLLLLLVSGIVCCLFKRGYNSMRAFLRYYIVQHPDKVQKIKAGQPTSMRLPRDRASLRPPNIPDIPEASKCTRHP